MDRHNVAIDAFRLITESRTSGMFVVYEIVHSLTDNESLDQITLLLPRRPEDCFLSHDFFSSEKISVLYPKKPYFPEKNFRNTVKWIQVVIPSMLKNSQVTHLISPYHQTPVFLRTSIKSITIIHDICGILPSAGYKYYKKGPYKHWFNFLTSIIRADGLVYVSKHTKTKYEKLFPFVKKRPSIICYSKPTLATNKDFNEFINLLKDIGLKYKEYFLAYGSSGIRKGTDITIGSYIKYKKEGGKKNLVLLSSKSNVDYIKNKIEERKYPIEIVTNLTNNERDAVYYGATALIFPSRCEGFGLPILEAMYQGCPPIAYKNSPANEIIGGCVPELEELNIDEVVKLMFFYDYQDEESQKLMTKKLRLCAAEFLENIEISKTYIELINSL